MDTFIVANRGFSQNHNRLANSVDPDEMAHYEPSHLNLHYFQRHLYWSTGIKGLKYFDIYERLGLIMLQLFVRFWQN